MSTPSNDRNDQAKSQEGSWGPKLFLATLVALLAFFYWLLIYSGGVTVNHG